MKSISWLLLKHEFFSPPVSREFYLVQSNTAAAAAAKSRQSCPTLCDPIDSSPLGSPIPGILQAYSTSWKMWVGQVSSRKMKHVWWSPSFASALEAKQLPLLRCRHVLPSFSTAQEQMSCTGLGIAWGLSILDDQSKLMLGGGLNDVVRKGCSALSWLET